MGKKIPEAVAKRLFENMFICVKCNAHMRAQPDKVKKGKVKCRRCSCKKLRLKAKERRGMK
ncbi:MAG TPA: 50S ribosomal protein L40e [archaeon]|nr:50S ribosomal protein L40e [archaeon]